MPRQKPEAEANQKPTRTPRKRLSIPLSEEATHAVRIIMSRRKITQADVLERIGRLANPDIRSLLVDLDAELREEDLPLFPSQDVETEG